MRTLPQLKRWEPNSYSEKIPKFSVALSNFEISQQVAQLLNTNNRLIVEHDINSIITSSVQYFIELYGPTVAGCVGLLREEKMDKIVHLSTSPLFRRKGIGKKLLLTAIDNSKKDVIYMHVREDNIGSLQLVTNVGFKIIAYIPKHDYNLFTLCLFRRK